MVSGFRFQVFSFCFSPSKTGCLCAQSTIDGKPQIKRILSQTSQFNFHFPLLLPVVACRQSLNPRRTKERPCKTAKLEEDNEKDDAGGGR